MRWWGTVISDKVNRNTAIIVRTTRSSVPPRHVSREFLLFVCACLWRTGFWIRWQRQRRSRLRKHISWNDDEFCICEYQPGKFVCLGYVFHAPKMVNRTSNLMVELRTSIMTKTLLARCWWAPAASHQTNQKLGFSETSCLYTGLHVCVCILAICAKQETNWTWNWMTVTQTPSIRTTMQPPRCWLLRF